MFRARRSRRLRLLELRADLFSELKSSQSVRGGNARWTIFPHGVDEMTKLEHERLVRRYVDLFDDAFLAVQRFFVVGQRAAVNRDLLAEEVGFDIRTVHNDLYDSHLLFGDPRGTEGRDRSVCEAEVGDSVVGYICREGPTEGE